MLDVEDVLLIHEEQLARYGGAAGVRDAGLLESAVAVPRASAGCEFAHEDLFAMAAAYAFHIAQNQPFLDGNKRTGLLAPSCSSTTKAGSSSPSRLHRSSRRTKPASRSRRLT